MKPTYKQIWLITYPILISLLMENLIGLTDTAFLGRVGEVELGASALAGVYYMAIFMIGFGFSIGTQILIARRNGEKAYADIGPLLQQGILFLLLLAAVMFVVSRTFTPVVLRWIIDSGPSATRRSAIRTGAFTAFSSRSSPLCSGRSTSARPIRRYSRPIRSRWC